LIKADASSILPMISRFSTWKNVFYILAISGLVLLPLLSIDAGISGDEEVHYLQSQKVLSYYKSLGKDTSALITPGSHLKYYGQSFDNFTTLLINLLNIEDIYLFRHISNSIVGWLAILVTGIVAIFLSGYRAGALTLLMLYLSPRFVGHAFNNLKDVPFAFAYILALYFIFRVIESLPKPRFKYILFLILAIGLAISVRIGGVLLILFLLLFTGLFIVSYLLKDNSAVAISNISRSILVVLLISLGGYLMGLVFWPYGLENPIKNPWIAFQVMTSFPTTLRQIFEGGYIWSDQLPWYYILKYLLITVPILVWMGFLLFLVFIKGILQSHRWIFILFLVITFAFPIFFVIYKGSNLYGAWRHLLFIYPSLVILSVLGYEHLLSKYSSKILMIIVVVCIMIMAFLPARFMIRNHPYQYVYFNELVGGTKNAFSQYETDYYFHSIRAGSEWLMDYISEKQPGEKVAVASNFPVSWLFRNSKSVNEVTYLKYYERGNVKWDYAIIANSYIHPYQLRKDIWPPQNTLHTINVEGVPICAILKRPSENDLEGLRLLNEGEYFQATRVLQKALVSDPANESVIMNLSMAYLMSGNLDSAQQALCMVKEVYPDYDVALDLMAEVYLKKGEEAAAKEVLQRNLKINPKYFPSCLKLAEIYLAEQNDELAIRYLWRCFSINPDYSPVLVKLGEYYEEKGDTILAKSFFDRVDSN